MSSATTTTDSHNKCPSFPTDLPPRPPPKRNIILRAFSAMLDRVTQKSASLLKYEEDNARLQYEKAEWYGIMNGDYVVDDFEGWWAKRRAKREEDEMREKKQK
jgi:hypothetical protein